MTTLSLKLNLPEQAAEDLRRLSAAAGQTEAEFLCAQVVRLTEKVRTFYELQTSPEDLKAIQAELRPYREAAPYKSEADFLNRNV